MYQQALQTQIWRSTRACMCVCARVKPLLSFFKSLCDLKVVNMDSNVTFEKVWDSTKKISKDFF